jgi:hypothetical protein
MRFTQNAVLSGSAEAYTNDRYVADLVLPYKPVKAELFKCDYYPVPQHLIAPDNRVGRLDPPPRLDFQAAQREFSTEDHAYDAAVPVWDTERADQQRAGNQMTIDPKKLFVAGLAEAQLLRREMRVARMVQTLTNYMPNLRQVLAASSQWDNPTSRPKDQIFAALDSMLRRANQMVLSRVAWTALRSHPQIVEAVLGTSAREGVASQQQVAELFELKEVVVGDAFAASSEIQDPDRPSETISRLWGNHCSLIYQNPNAQAIAGSNQFTYGYTARVGGRRVMEWFSEDIGARGADMMRVLDVEKELITASFCGYLFRDCVPASASFSMNNVM